MNFSSMPSSVWEKCAGIGQRGYEAKFLINYATPIYSKNKARDRVGL